MRFCSPAITPRLIPRTSLVIQRGVIPGLQTARIGPRARPSSCWSVNRRMARGSPWGIPAVKLKPGRHVTFGADSAVEIVEVLAEGCAYSLLWATSTHARPSRGTGKYRCRRTSNVVPRKPIRSAIRRSTRRTTSVSPHRRPVCISPRSCSRGFMRAQLRDDDRPARWAGTFKPVETDNLDEHTNASRVYEIVAGAANWVNKGQRRGGWGVGSGYDGRPRVGNQQVDSHGEVRAGPVKPSCSFGRRMTSRS